MEWIKKFVRSSRFLKDLFVVILFLLILNIFVATLSTYISSASFFDETAVTLLSNLLFLEGALTFTVGIFLHFFFSIGHGRGDSSTKEEAKPYQKYVSLGAFMTIAGVLLLILSICVGELLL